MYDALFTTGVFSMSLMLKEAREAAAAKTKADKEARAAAEKAAAEKAVKAKAFAIKNPH